MKYRFIYYFMSLLFTLLFMSTGCNTGSEKIKADSKLTVRTESVIEKELSETIHSSGVLQSSDVFKLSFKTGGIVDKIHVHEGETVKKGRLLAELKPDEMNAQLERARTAHDKSERDFERASTLYTDNAITLQQKQDAESAHKLAASNLDIAEFNAKYSKIVAPGNGKILKQVVEENELIDSGTPVIVFASTDNNWIVKTQITDKDIVKLQLGDTASVFFDAYPGNTFSGEVSEISEFANPGTGLYELEVTLSAKPDRLINGLVAKIDIFTSTKRKHFFIPIDALVEARGNDGFVYTVDENDCAVKVPVKILSVRDEYMAVNGDLANSRVVTSGAPYLMDGDKINVSPAPDSITWRNK